MSSVRIVARLDVKAPNLIKGVHLEGLRKIGDPNVFARRYFDAGIDEIIYMDIVASLYGRNNIFDIVSRTTSEVFVPITVGGGIRSVEDVRMALQVGADKVAINTAAVRRPELISDIARTFGSQCLVLSIEAKRHGTDKWEAYVDNGREHTGLDAIEWARHGEVLGAGEILLTSIDQEGTRGGFDVELTKAVSSVVRIPVIASGGFGTTDDLVSIVEGGGADAVAIADALHYLRYSVPQIRDAAAAAGLAVRSSPPPVRKRTSRQAVIAPQVVIADYGIGNLKSVVRAFEALDVNATLSSDPDVLAKADRLVVPGVGAFADCMRALEACGFVPVLHEHVKRGRPLLGICVGMQMLFESSEEFGWHPGLGFIPGHVRRVSDVGTDGAPVKVPHVGWAALRRPASSNDDRWAASILRDIAEGDPVYFVHSFVPYPEREAHRIADVYHGGHALSAVAGYDNIVGTQFHPEKSGSIGLSILARFLEI